MANEKQLEITLTADMSALQDALQKAGYDITGFAKNSRDAIDTIGPSLMKAALGFGTMAGAANKAAGMIIDGLKAVVNFIPNSIKATDDLATTYKGLAITAGMSVHDFNAWNATVELSGGKAEDLTSIVQGMERGIKTHSDALVANGIAADKAALSQMTMGEYISAVVTRMDSLSSATEKDQLMMLAFGKSGMAFASMLEDINKNQAEGQELAKKGSVIDAQTIKDRDEITAAQGRYNLAMAKTQAEVAHWATQSDIALLNAKAAMVTFGEASKTAFDLANQGLISDGVEINRWGQHVIVDMDKATAAAIRYNKELDRMFDREQQKQNTASAAVEAAKPKTHVVTPEDLTAQKEAAKQRENELDAIKKANRAAYNALITDGNELTKKELDLKTATTREGKLDLENRQALYSLSESLTKVKDTVGKSNDADVLAQGQRDRAKAIELYNAQIAANQEKYDADTLKEQTRLNSEILSGQLEHDRALNGIETESINAKHDMGLISDAQQISALRKLNNEMFELELSALDDKLIIYKDDAVEEQKVANQILALWDKHDRDKIALEIKTQSELKKTVDSWAKQSESSLASNLTAVIVQHKKAGDAIKSVFTDMASSVINDLIKMGIHQMLYATMATAAQKTVTAGAATNLAEQKGIDTASGTSSDVSMASKLYNFFSGMGPWGIALAAVTIAGVLMAIGSISGREKGGNIDAGTPYMVGEKGPELIIPGHHGTVIPNGLTNQIGSMYGAISASNSRANTYSASRQAGLNQGGGSQAPVVNVNIAGHVIGSSAESMRVMGKLVNDSVKAYGQANG
jgi:hypothetical protein